MLHTFHVGALGIEALGIYLGKGRRQNTSVETGDFLQKNVKCMLVEFCRSVTPSPHVRVKGHLGGDSQLLLYYTW